jgi:hypothetical protein
MVGRPGRTSVGGRGSSGGVSSSSWDKDPKGKDEDDDSLQAADVRKAPSAELLSDLELQLCCSVPMLPTHYLAAKDAIVRLVYYSH